MLINVQVVKCIITMLMVHVLKDVLKIVYIALIKTLVLSVEMDMLYLKILTLQRLYANNVFLIVEPVLRMLQVTAYLVDKVFIYWALIVLPVNKISAVHVQN